MTGGDKKGSGVFENDSRPLFPSFENDSRPLFPSPKLVLRGNDKKSYMTIAKSAAGGNEIEWLDDEIDKPIHIWPRRR
jgi:hypothetical protein